MKAKLSGLAAVLAALGFCAGSWGGDRKRAWVFHPGRQR